MRAMIVAKGYTESVNDLDDIYASTPIFCVLKALLTICLNRGWIARTGDISTAYLHAAGATADLFIHESTKGVIPTRGQHQVETSESNLWAKKQPKRLAKPPGRSPATLGLQRSTAEPNIFMTPTRDCYILVYVDDLLFLGEQLFTAISQQLLLRPAGTLEPGKTVSFLGRSITNNGDSYDISLSQDYVANILESWRRTTC